MTSGVTDRRHDWNHFPPTGLAVPAARRGAAYHLVGAGVDAIVGGGATSGVGAGAASRVSPSGVDSAADDTGIDPATVVPFPGLEVIASEPPSASTRSAMF